MKRPDLSHWLITALLLVFTSLQVSADPREHPPNREPRNHQRSVNEVIGEVEKGYGGKVVGVQQTQREQEPMYRVRVLQRNGRVKTIMVPATGRH